MGRAEGPELAKMGKKREWASNLNDFNWDGLLPNIKYLINPKEVL